MPGRDIKLRFAPSPTGHLHLGTARIAVLNWLFAKRYNGVFLLRFEDTDPERSQSAFADSILADLEWLGIRSDEEPVFQSQRAEIYRKHLDLLLENDDAYPCFCTEQELRAERDKAAAKGHAPRYSGRCRSLSPEEIQERSQDAPPAYRVRVPAGGTGFTDLLRGELQFPESAFDDYIVMRSNGIPSYNFAVVVDDYEMGISHVLRGEDHLSNTARQQVLISALGLEPPDYLHVGLVVGPDGSKLSKREGALSIAELREQGMSSATVVNYVALLGWSTSTGQEIFDPEGLAKAFEWERLSTSPGKWDPDKLRWVARQHFHALDTSELALDAARLGLERGIAGDRDQDWWLRLTQLFKGELYDIGGLLEQALLYSGDLSYSDQAIEMLADPLAREVLQTFTFLIEDNGELGKDQVQELIGEVKKQFMDRGYGAGKVMLPLRLALTAQRSGPELWQCITLLGREKVIERLSGAVGTSPERMENG